ncbi:hypothetical protein A2U01_0104818, partial [Trifolium medium]|nr:hypothetical protein [Trifolium medium]
VLSLVRRAVVLTQRAVAFW